MSDEERSAALDGGKTTCLPKKAGGCVAEEGRRDAGGAKEGRRVERAARKGGCADGRLWKGVCVEGRLWKGV